MTIFDSIKYPISDEVTTDEVYNIPDDLWNEWADSPQRKNLKQVIPGDQKYSAALRQFILEWNNDNL